MMKVLIENYSVKIEKLRKISLSWNLKIETTRAAEFPDNSNEDDSRDRNFN